MPRHQNNGNVRGPATGATDNHIAVYDGTTGRKLKDSTLDATAVRLHINNFVTKTANYTILSTDDIIFVDSSGGPFTLTLPSPASLGGKIYYIVDVTGFLNTNNVTLAPSGSEKIEGLAASKVLQTAWGWFGVTTNSVDWFVG